MFHIIMDKLFLPFFYSVCIIGLIIAGINFIDVKEEREKQLLTIEKTLNIESTNEEIKLQLNEENTNKNVIYVSSNEDIVKVDESGNLRSISEGSAIITVKTIDEKYVQSFIVNVGQNAIETSEEE